jgi:hypothetical protein
MGAAQTESELSKPIRNPAPASTPVFKKSRRSTCAINQLPNAMLKKPGAT